MRLKAEAMIWRSPSVGPPAAAPLPAADTAVVAAPDAPPVEVPRVCSGRRRSGLGAGSRSATGPLEDRADEGLEKVDLRDRRRELDKPAPIESDGEDNEREGDGDPRPVSRLDLLLAEKDDEQGAEGVDRGEENPDAPREEPHKRPVVGRLPHPREDPLLAVEAGGDERNGRQG